MLALGAAGGRGGRVPVGVRAGAAVAVVGRLRCLSRRAAARRAGLAAQGVRARRRAHGAGCTGAGFWGLARAGGGCRLLARAPGGFRSKGCGSIMMWQRDDDLEFLTNRRFQFYVPSPLSLDTNASSSRAHEEPSQSQRTAHASRITHHACSCRYDMDGRGSGPRPPSPQVYPVFHHKPHGRNAELTMSLSRAVESLQLAHGTVCRRNLRPLLFSKAA